MFTQADIFIRVYSLLWTHTNSQIQSMHTYVSWDPVSKSGSITWCCNLSKFSLGLSKVYTGNCIPALKPRLSIVCSYYTNQTKGALQSQGGQGRSPTSLSVARENLRKSSTVTRQTVCVWLLEVCFKMGKNKCKLNFLYTQRLSVRINKAGVAE